MEPKANAVLRSRRSTALRASYGHGFRPPYFGELYLYTPPSSWATRTSMPEVSDGFTRRLRVVRRAGQLSADGYFTKVKNGIIFFQLTPSRSPT